MATILDTIIERKKAEVGFLRKEGIPQRDQLPPHRPFVKALDRSPLLSVIAEVKKASPSKGLLCKDFDPSAIAQRYQKGGASAISVLTDQKFFQGHTEYLLTVRRVTDLPVIRKDFIIDPLQVQETAAIGADAMLLIAAALSDAQLDELYAAASEYGIEPLIEIHTFGELERVMNISPAIIGINNRNLSTFVTDIGVTIELIREIPGEITVVAESGIHDASQAIELRNAGVKALLVGESLMKSPDPETLIRELTLENGTV